MYYDALRCIICTHVNISGDVKVNVPAEDTLMRLAGQGAFQGGEVSQYSHPIIPPLTTIALCGPFILFV